MFIRRAWFVLVTFYLTVSFVVDCGLISPRDLDRNHQLNAKKRPFCNAFTGCGRKRSENLAANLQNDIGENDAEDVINDLVEMNSEPAVENLMRQIMSQAKLWEALQEVSRDAYAQKLGNNERQGRYPGSFSAQRTIFMQLHQQALHRILKLRRK